MSLEALHVDLVAAKADLRQAVLDLSDRCLHFAAKWSLSPFSALLPLPAIVQDIL
jgi:hypothetical protein